MDFDKGLRVSVTERGRATVRVVIESGSALIGSGSHCDIRLGPEQVAIEQLFFELQAGGIFAEARSAVPPVLIGGVPFQRGRVLPGRDFEVGALQIGVELVEPSAKKLDGKQRVRPGLLLVAALALCFGTYLIVSRQSKEDTADYRSAPPLFNAAPVTCPKSTPAAASASIDDWLRDAAGRHERAPFSPRDGVEAVLLYRKVASCMQTFDRGGEATEWTNAADLLAQRLEGDFHVHRVRLSRALSAGQTSDARHEVGLLRGYLGQPQSDFALWLDYLDRKLGLQGKSK